MDRIEDVRTFRTAEPAAGYYSLWHGYAAEVVAASRADVAVASPGTAQVRTLQPESLPPL